MMARQSAGWLAVTVVFLTCSGCESDDLQARIGELESTVRKLERTLESKTDDLESKTYDLESSIDDLESETDDLESEISGGFGLASRIDDLESRMPNKVRGEVEGIIRLAISDHELYPH